VLGQEALQLRDRPFVGRKRAAELIEDVFFRKRSLLEREPPSVEADVRVLILARRRQSEGERSASVGTLRQEKTTLHQKLLCGNKPRWSLGRLSYPQERVLPQKSRDTRRRAPGTLLDYAFDVCSDVIIQQMAFTDRDECQWLTPILRGAL
jgi:hypothetical protein